MRSIEELAAEAGLKGDHIATKDAEAWRALRVFAALVLAEAARMCADMSPDTPEGFEKGIPNALDCAEMLLAKGEELSGPRPARSCTIDTVAEASEKNRRMSVALDASPLGPLPAPSGDDFPAMVRTFLPPLPPWKR